MSVGNGSPVDVEPKETKFFFWDTDGSYSTDTSWVLSWIHSRKMEELPNSGRGNVAMNVQHLDILPYGIETWFFSIAMLLCWTETDPL